MIGILWLVEIVNIFLLHNLNRFGILPRTIKGLLGIPLAPFLHASIAHAISNTVPLFILGTIVLIKQRENFIQTVSMIVLLGGFIVWLFGSRSFHFGASGLVFGLFGYLVAQGLYRTDLISFLLAVFVFIGYGSILWGVLPIYPGISWIGHVGGLVSGVYVAYHEKTGKFFL